MGAPYEPALIEAVRRGLAGFLAEEIPSLSQWADQHFYLSPESSYVEGPWKAQPFQRGILDAMGSDEVEKVTIKKSARVGASKMIVAAICYNASARHRNQAIWQPTDDDRDEWVKTELEPALRDVKPMRTVFPEFLARHKDNTLKQKRLIGSMIYTRGGKSAKNYRRISVDVAFIDEFNAFDRDIDGEGDAGALSAKRLEGATFPKQVVVSTPKIKGASHISTAADSSDIVLRYHIACPHCGDEHPLLHGMLSFDEKRRRKGGGFRWVAGSPESVRHECPACGALISQAEYLEAAERGRYKADDGRWLGPGGKFFDRTDRPVPTPKRVAFLVWTAYSAQASWAGIVTEREAAGAALDAGKPELAKTFTNTTLGEDWELKGAKVEASELKALEDHRPARTVPRRGLYLEAGVDTQDDRWEVAVWAIGRGDERWLVENVVIHGDPAKAEDWDALDQYLLSTFPVEGGGEARIDDVAIDSGGHHTHMVYNFCRRRSARRVRAIKGDNVPGKPIAAGSRLVDVNLSGRIIKGGVRLYFVGTDTAKDELHACLQLTGSGPGRIHFHRDVRHEFYQHLAAEQRELVRTASGDVYRWVLVDTRNEGLDGTVYAMFCSALRGTASHTEGMWKNRENQLVGLWGRPLESAVPEPQPAKAVPSAAQAPVAPAPAPPPQARRRTSEGAPPARNPFASEAWLRRR